MSTINCVWNHLSVDSVDILNSFCILIKVIVKCNGPILIYEGTRIKKLILYNDEFLNSIFSKMTTPKQFSYFWFSFYFEQYNFPDFNCIVNLRSRCIQIQSDSKCFRSHHCTRLIVERRSMAARARSPALENQLRRADYSERATHINKLVFIEVVCLLVPLKLHSNYRLPEHCDVSFRRQCRRPVIASGKLLPIIMNN